MTIEYVRRTLVSHPDHFSHLTFRILVASFLSGHRILRTPLTFFGFCQVKALQRLRSADTYRLLETYVDGQASLKDDLVQGRRERPLTVERKKGSGVGVGGKKRGGASGRAPVWEGGGPPGTMAAGDINNLLRDAPRTSPPTRPS